MNEDMPFASFGGLTARHTFPLDGEYAFQLRLERDQDGIINGIMAEHQIELRVDRQLVKRFEIGGEFKEPDAGQLIAVPEDDELGKAVHKYYISADDALTIRVPIKAGTRTVTASFVEYRTGSERQKPPGERLPRAESERRRRHGPARPDVDFRTVQSDQDRGHAGAPHDPRLQAPGGKRRQRRRLRATDPDGAGPTRLSRLQRHRGRRSTARDLQERTDRPRLRHRHRARARSAARRRRSSCCASSTSPAAPNAGARVRLSDLELASRLSFFLWRSIPDEELLEARRAQPTEGSRASSASRFGGCWPTNGRDRVPERLLGAVARGAQPQLADSRRAQFQFDPTLREAMARETRALLREPGARRSADSGSAARQLHVPERAAGAALRHRRRLRQPFPSRHADRRATGSGCSARPAS